MRRAEWKQLALPVERIRRLFEYDPESGLLVWKYREPVTPGDKGFNRRRGGKPAGHVGSRGYIQVTLSNPDTAYLAHRLIWAMVTGAWPEHEVDHRDGCRSNNAWLNLRRATPAENCRNKKTPLGIVKYKGVTYEKHLGRYRARIVSESGRRSLGLFGTPEDAAMAYDRAAFASHGEFAVTNHSLGLFEVASDAQIQ